MTPTKKELIANKIESKHKELDDNYRALAETKQTKEWLDISSKIASLSVDIDNLKKQMEYAYSKSTDYVPDRIEIVIPKNK